MNIIPKYKQGGSYTLFEALQIPTPRDNHSISRSYQREDKEDKDKGELTEKDLFSMIKELDGLPNEIDAFTNDLDNMFRLQKFTGVSNLHSMYINNLRKIKILKQNKIQYDEALKKASENGSLQEPAIAPNGQLIAQMKDGKITTIDLNTYFNNTDKYQPLTVSNIAYIRRYDPNFINNQESFDIIQNSMSFELFQKLIDSAKANLGTSTSTKNGNFAINDQAIKGLELLQTLDKDDLAQIYGSVTAQGLYEYKIIDKNQKHQIEALTTYMLAALPDRAKTWAAIKLQNPDKIEATKNLILQYLSGTQTIEHTVETTYKGSMNKVMGGASGSGSNSNGEDPKEGFWRQVQSGKGGMDKPYSIIFGNTKETLNGGKYYGKTPGPEKNCSLSDYINQSGLGYLKTGANEITFGNIELSSDSYNDVMVNVNSGAYAVTLPAKNGKVWIEAIEIYENFKKELKKLNIPIGTPQYNQQVQNILKKPEYSSLAPLIQSNGELNPNNSMHFLVLEGITSSKARGITNDNKKQSISDFDTEFIINAGDDKELYRTLQEGLSSKDGGEYKLDYNEWYDMPSWFGNYDKIYKGNIYIPINTNPINASNADDNDIKASTAKEYESAQQTWNKMNKQNITSSRALQ